VQLEPRELQEILVYLGLWEILVYLVTQDLLDHRATLVYREIRDLWEILVYLVTQDLLDPPELLD